MKLGELFDETDLQNIRDELAGELRGELGQRLDLTQPGDRPRRAEQGSWANARLQWHRQVESRIDLFTTALGTILRPRIAAAMAILANPAAVRAILRNVYLGAYDPDDLPREVQAVAREYGKPLGDLSVEERIAHITAMRDALAGLPVAEDGEERDPRVDEYPHTGEIASAVEVLRALLYTMESTNPDYVGADEDSKSLNIDPRKHQQKYDKFVEEYAGGPLGWRTFWPTYRARWRGLQLRRAEEARQQGLAFGTRTVSQRRPKAPTPVQTHVQIEHSGGNHGVFRTPITLYRALDEFELRVLAAEFHAGLGPAVGISGGRWATGIERMGGASFGADRDEVVSWALHWSSGANPRLRRPLFLIQVDGAGRAFVRENLERALEGDRLPMTACGTGLGCSIRPEVRDVQAAWQIADDGTLTPVNFTQLLARTEPGNARPVAEAINKLEDTFDKFLVADRLYNAARKKGESATPGSLVATVANNEATTALDTIEALITPGLRAAYEIVAASFPTNTILRAWRDAMGRPPYNKAAYARWKGVLGETAPRSTPSPKHASVAADEWDGRDGHPATGAHPTPSEVRAMGQRWGSTRDPMGDDYEASAQLVLAVWRAMLQNASDAVLADWKSTRGTSPPQPRGVFTLRDVLVEVAGANPRLGDRAFDLQGVVMEEIKAEERRRKARAGREARAKQEDMGTADLHRRLRQLRADEVKWKKEQEQTAQFRVMGGLAKLGSPQSAEIRRLQAEIKRIEGGG